MDKHFIKELLLDALFGLCVALCISAVAVLTSEVVKADQVVSDNAVVSGDCVSCDCVSCNCVSGNVVSGNFITFQQGDQIIFYLRILIFIVLFSFCFERIRNGIRSFNKTR